MHAKNKGSYDAYSACQARYSLSCQPMEEKQKMHIKVYLNISFIMWSASSFYNFVLLFISMWRLIIEPAGFVLADCKYLSSWCILETR